MVSRKDKVENSKNTGSSLSTIVDRPHRQLVAAKAERNIWPLGQRSKSISEHPCRGKASVSVFVLMRTRDRFRILKIVFIRVWEVNPKSGGGLRFYIVECTYTSPLIHSSSKVCATYCPSDVCWTHSLSRTVWFPVVGSDSISTNVR